MLPDAPRRPVACPEEDKVDCKRRQREEWRVESSLLHGKKFSFSAEWKSCWLHFSLNRDFKSFVDLTLEGNWVLCLRTNRFWLSSHIYSRSRIIFTRVGFSNEIRDSRSRWEHCERCVVDGSSHRTIWTTCTSHKNRWMAFMAVKACVEFWCEWTGVQMMSQYSINPVKK